MFRQLYTYLTIHPALLPVCVCLVTMIACGIYLHAKFPFYLLCSGYICFLIYTGVTDMKVEYIQLTLVFVLSTVFLSMAYRHLPPWCFLCILGLFAFLCIFICAEVIPNLSKYRDLVYPIHKVFYNGKHFVQHNLRRFVYAVWWPNTIIYK